MRLISIRRNLKILVGCMPLLLSCSSRGTAIDAKLEQTTMSAEQNNKSKNTSCKAKVLVYPPNDVAPMKRNGEKKAGSPEEYCNEEDLINKKDNLFKSTDGK